MRLNILPLIVNQKSYSEALAWQPHLRTQFLIIDRDHFTMVQRGEAPAWFQWQVTHGCLMASDVIRLQLVRYADFATNEYLREVSAVDILPALKGKNSFPGCRVPHFLGYTTFAGGGGCHDPNYWAGAQIRFTARCTLL